MKYKNTPYETFREFLYAHRSITFVLAVIECALVLAALNRLEKYAQALGDAGFLIYCAVIARRLQFPNE